MLYNLGEESPISKRITSLLIKTCLVLITGLILAIILIPTSPSIIQAKVVELGPGEVRFIKPVIEIDVDQIINPSADTTQTSTQTIVSLEFDDGTLSQLKAKNLLERYGMRGTFFVNSGRIGKSNYLTKEDLLNLQANGHEIGGHTVNHKRLTSLSREEQLREVGDDRAALEAMGLKITNFAYPFSSYNDDVKAVVKECGYLSGRRVGRVGCSGCPAAETIPPVDPYATRTVMSFTSSTTLAQMQNYIIKAEQNGGGWVQLNFHHICNKCSTYSMTEEQLDSFLSWLKLRESQGTIVKTVHEVITGESTPTPLPAPAPSPEPTPAPEENLIKNPSLEFDDNADKVPDCWMLGGYGTNKYSWTRTSDAHTGSWAEQLDITSRTSGDRKLVTSQKSSTCAPVPEAGHTYKLSAWYKSNQPVYLATYYKTSSGSWKFWTGL